MESSRQNMSSSLPIIMTFEWNEVFIAILDPNYFIHEDGCLVLSLRTVYLYALNITPHYTPHCTQHYTPHSIEVPICNKVPKQTRSFFVTLDIWRVQFTGERKAILKAFGIKEILRCPALPPSNICLFFCFCRGISFILFFSFSFTSISTPFIFPTSLGSLSPHWTAFQVVYLFL